jgi:O-acetylserine/cysteine efflux transporter
MGGSSQTKGLDMSPRDSLQAVFVTAVWGLNFVVGKWALAELPSVLTMALRFAMVALLLVPFVKTPWADMKRIALLSFTLGLVHFGMMFSGLSGTDAGLASILVQSQVPFTVIIAAAFFKDWPTMRQWAGMALAFFGIWLALGEPRIGGSDAFHIGLILAASFVWAVANFQMKALGHVDGFALNAYMALLAAPQLLLASAAIETSQIAAIADASLWAWTGVAYMACLVTIVTYWMWYRLLRRYSVGEVMPYSLLVPVFGVLSGVVMMGDPFGWRTAAGALVTLAGVGAITLQRKHVPQ